MIKTVLRKACATLLILPLCLCLVSAASAMGKKPAGNTNTENNSPGESNEPGETIKNYIQDPSQSTTPGDLLIPGASRPIHNVEPPAVNSGESGSDNNSGESGGNNNGGGSDN